MSRSIDLMGKRALVTGGTRGIGRATALLLAEAGADVGVSCRSREEEGAAVVDACRRMGRHAWLECGDLSLPEGVETLFWRVDHEFGGLDLLVVNHGVWVPDEVPLQEMTDEQWHDTMGANLHSVFYTCRSAIGRLTDGGRIVLVSSTAAQRGEAWHGDYAASKGAIISLVKSLCVELAPRDVTVNAVAPGWVDTEMAAPALRERGASAIAGEIPLGRVADPEDVAGPILFLCSDLARHVTGEILNVNGGSVLAG